MGVGRSHRHSLGVVGGVLATALHLHIFRVLRSFLESRLLNLLCDGHMTTGEMSLQRPQASQLQMDC